MKNVVIGKITPLELLFSAATFVQGSSLLSSFFVGVLKQNSWLGVLAAYLISLTMLMVYLFLLNRHPGKGLIQLNEAVFGKVLGKAVSLCYLFYFFTLIPLNTADIGGFMTAYIMPETPTLAITALFLLPAVLAARKGIDAIFRYGALFSIFQLCILTLYTVMLIPEIRSENMLPLLDITLKEFVQGTNTIVALPFNELIVLMMFAPMITEPKKAKGALLGGFSIGAAVMLIIVLVDTAVLGPLLEYFVIPRYQSARLINLFDVFNRMDILYIFTLIIMRFFKVSILLYGASLALSQIFGLSSCVPMVSVLGTLAAFYSLFAFRSLPESLDWGQHTAGVFSAFFNILLPLLTLMVYAVRSTVTRLKPLKS